MPVQIRPHGRIGVEIFAATKILQYGASALNDNNRLAPQPILHLSERMPDMLVIKRGQRVHSEGRGAKGEGRGLNSELDSFLRPIGDVGD